MTSKELREKRATLANQARAILDKAEAEKRDLSAEEQAEFDRIHADIDRMKADIDRMERQEKLDLELAAAQPTIAGGKQTIDDPLHSSDEDRKKQEAEAFRSWLVYGVAGLTPEQRAIMATRQAQITPEMRAQAVGIDTAGGYLVPDGFVPRIETAMKAFAGVRNTRATIIRTSSGETINMPTSDDTSNKGELLAENVATGEQDLTFGSKALRAYMFTSKMVKVSIQFLQDVGIADIEGWLADRLGERVGRAQADYHITGTGSNQPEGLATAATLGVTAASATAVTYDELVDLEHSVNPAYRRQAEWLMGDGMVKLLKKLKDGEGRPLWVPGVAVREPDTILGYRYAIAQEIPDPASAKITVYFGDFSKYHLRDVRQMQMLRLTERYAEYLQVAFLLFVRHDAILLDAGTNPVKYLKQAS